MRIFLEGDQLKASEWIGWAKSRLRVLKSRMNDIGRQVASKRFKINDGIEIAIKSVLGQDEIRIAAVGEEGFYDTGKIHALPNIWGAQIDPTTRWRVEKRSYRDGHVITLNDFGTPLEVSPTYYATTVPTVRDKFVYIIDNTYFGSWASGYPAKWRIQRRKLIGTLLWEQTLLVFEAMISGLTTDTNNLYVAGITQQSAYTDPYFGRIEKRAKEDGVVAWSNSLPQVYPNCIVFNQYVDIDGIVRNNLYVGEHYYDPGYYNINTWRVHKYDSETGAGGWYEDYNGGHGASPGVIVVDADGLYIGGTRSNPYADAYARVERRNKKTGVLVWEFIDPDYVASQTGNSNVVTSIVLTPSTVLVSTRLLYHGIWYTSALTALDKITGVMLWTVQMGTPGVTHDATLEGLAFLDPNDGNAIMGCSTVDNHYLFKKRSSANGSVMWETQPSQLYGL